MGTTLMKNSKRGADPKKLTGGEQKFVLELLAAGDWNLAAAVRKAYPKCKNPAQYGTKLMKRKRIADILGKIQQEDVERLELDRAEVLLQMYYAATREIRDFHDKQGRPLLPHQLPKRCQSIIDKVKTKVRRFTQEDGTVEEDIEHEYTLTPHAVAREQALKQMGMFAPSEIDLTASMMREFFERLQQAPKLDPVEERLRLEEGKIEVIDVEHEENEDA